MEGVGEEDVVCVLVSLDQGVKLREPTVEQAGQLPDVVPWSPGKEGLLCAHGGQAAWDSVPCNWEELILAGLVTVLIVRFGKQYGSVCFKDLGLLSLFGLLSILDPTNLHLRFCL